MRCHVPVKATPSATKMRLQQARHNSTSHCHEYYIGIYLYIIQDRACQTMPETGYSNISP